MLCPAATRSKSTETRESGRGTGLVDERDDLGNDLTRRFIDEPVPGAFDDHSLDVGRDQARLLDEELSGRLFAGQHEDRHGETGGAQLGEVLGVALEVAE